MYLTKSELGECFSQLSLKKTLVQESNNSCQVETNFFLSQGNQVHYC